MSKYTYKPTTWIGGKTIGTADVMNNIEEGIEKAHERLNNLGDIPSGEINGSVDLSNYATKEELKMINTKLNEIIEYIYNIPVSENSIHIKSKTGLNILKSGAENNKSYKIAEKINFKEIFDIKTNLTMGVEK